jgi:hypothetical protein
MTKLLTVCLALALLGAACGGGAPHASDGTSTAANSARPPLMVVSSGTATLETALGSYCWSKQGQCADAIAVVTSHQPLATVGATSITGTLDGFEITNVYVDSSPAASSSSMLLQGGLVVWTGASEHTTLPATASDGEVQIDISALDPGQYVVAITVEVKDKGDATYGFLLDKDVVGG